MIYSVGGDAVLSAKQIGALDIELVDILPLILYLPALADVDAGHTFQDVADAPILRLCEATDIVSNRIPLLPNTVRFHRHLLQHGGGMFHDYCHR